MRKVLRVILYIIGGILLLVLLLVLLLQTPWGKGLLRQQVVSYLKTKLKTEIVLARLDYSIPESLTLEGLLIRDRQNDTLAYIRQLHVDIKMLALLNNKVVVNKLILDGVNAHVYRINPDTAFNYQFIIEAFATPESEPNVAQDQDTSSSTPLVLDVGKVQLTDVRLRYNDNTGGTYFSMHLGDLVLRPQTIDLDKSKFAIKELSINQLQSYVATDTSYLPPLPPDTSAATDMLLSVEKLDLNQVKFAYLGKEDSMYFNIALDQLNGQLSKFGLLQQHIDVPYLKLEGVQSSVVMGKPQPKAKVSSKQVPKDTDTAASDWRVLVGNLMLNKINFAFDNNADPRLQQGMDYSHLKFSDLSLNTDKVVYGPDTISGNVKLLALKEKSGLWLTDFKTNFIYHSKGAFLNNFYLQTPGTLLQDKIEVSYPSIAALQKELNKMYLNIALNKSKVDMQDVFLFLPDDQRKNLKDYARERFLLDVVMKGHLNDLILNRFAVKGLAGSDIDINGTLKGLPDADKLSYQLNLNKVATTFKAIAPFVPESVQEQIRIPDWFDIKGKISGTVNEYHPNVLIKTADGNASINGMLSMAAGEGKEKYDLSVALDALNLGKILRQDTLIGSITLNTDIKGIGFDPKNMNTTFDANIVSAYAMKYGFKGIHLNGSIIDQSGVIKGYSTDPNLNFSLDALFNLSNAYPALTANLDLHNLDLQALKLSSDTLQLKGNISADFSSLNPDYPAGKLVYAQPQIKMPGYALQLDSIVFASNPTADSNQQLSLNVANVLQLNMDGHIPLTQVGNAALFHINEHYRITDSMLDLPANYNVNLDAHVVFKPVLRQWVPSLRPFDTIKINGAITPSSFDLKADIPKLVYGTTKLDSISFRMFERGDTMRYGLAAKHLIFNQYDIWYPSVSGRLLNDSIYTRLAVRDADRKEQFALGAAMHHDLDDTAEITSIRMYKGLVLDYDRWEVNPANRIQLGKNGFYVSDLSISRGNESINIYSDEPVQGSILNAEIKNFSLSNLTRMLSRDTLIADGKLNVLLMADLSDTFPKMYAKAHLDSLVAFGNPVGNLELNASNNSANTYLTFLSLSGNQNDVKILGQYNIEPVAGNQLDFKVAVNALYLKSLEGFTFGSIKNSSGFIKGELSIAGTNEKPRILGKLNTDKLTTTVAMLGAPYTMDNEEIRFAADGIRFEDFKIKDAKGNIASIKGRVLTPDFQKYMLSLNVNAKNWMAINSKPNDFEMFYGKLLISTNLIIKGSATAPEINGNLTVHDSTNLTYAMIDNGPGIQETEGIVQFVDVRDTFAVDSTLLERNPVMVSRATQMNINVDVEPTAKINVIIDPSTGDELSVQGEAHLNTFIGPDGAVGLTGTYELRDGFYELNYNFLKKKFKVQKGSVITLSGDPLDAEVDIVAVYNAIVAPFELVERQVSSSEINLYRQRLPFEVQLKLKGKVLKPEISFDIVFPESKQNVVSTTVAETVQRKLQEIRNDPSVLNKQVFAALIMNRFITDDPFSSGAGGGLEFAARQSASRFLSDQLNKIAGSLIKGVDLSIGLESNEDYSSGQKSNVTNLNVTASKQLFDDRLKLTVGNDFQIEGQQQQHSSVLPGNLAAEYKLSTDGRYNVRAYRVNQIQNIIDGFVIETGVSFKMIVEFNRLKQIFRKAQQRNARASAVKTEEKPKS